MTLLAASLVPPTASLLIHKLQNIARLAILRLQEKEQKVQERLQGKGQQGSSMPKDW